VSPGALGPVGCVLVEMGVVAAPPGYEPVPWHWDARRRVVHRRGCAEELLMALAHHHASAHPEAMGLLYLDGHVRAYHGGADLQRAHLARAMIAMAATTGTWLADRNGDAVLVCSSVPGGALSGELAKAVSEVCARSWRRCPSDHLH